MLKKTKVMLLILLTLACVPQFAWSADWRFENVDRVVAISDIHGAYDAMVTTLKNAKVLADDLSWSGGKTNLVIVGDILDRGPQSRAAMDLLMRIEVEAEQAGGRVLVLIGNHESMILTGDMRYVSAPEYEAFAGDEDPEERAEWFAKYVEQQGGSEDELRAKFDKKFPPGYFAMRRAFRADGHYGQWLLQKNIIGVINGTAFVHGGLSPEIARIGVAGVNEGLQRELVEFVKVLAILTDAGILLPTDSHYDYAAILGNYMPSLADDAELLQAIKTAIRLNDSELLAPNGPLWYRSNANCQTIIEEGRLAAVLEAIDVDRLVIGHTPTPNRQILQRFGGQLIEIDTGMLNFYYKGIGHALVLEGASVAVVDQAGAQALVPEDHPRHVGWRAGNLTTAELEQLLLKGEIVSVEKDTKTGTPRTVVKVSDGTNAVLAIFEKSARNFYPGVAAYRVDQLLDLEMVPVTVRREVNGDSGSLQFLPGNNSDEAERSAQGLGGGASCSIVDQWSAMYVFDVLIFNEGRSQSRMMYDKSSWDLILSEHDRAFAAKKGRPAHLKKAAIPVSPGWKAALAELNDEVLQESLGDVLDSGRLKALMSRRDELIASP
ncbi:MAG: metallophosphoesterase [Gammaproteobacteria bacterium]|nr:metallophosphoesterase [Gammaproteobacteria bacterium]